VRGESIEKCIIPKEKEKNIMNTLVLLLICVAVLLCGYIFYGGWLCKQWGVGDSKEETPAHTLADGVDYVPAKAPVLMGHHFSSIAGAGPITGPINAALFGWLPVTLWILVGGIFFGGVHDFGALFASIRHKGQSIGEIISVNMSKRAKRLFLIFAYLTLLLVVAAFASIVATTFGATYVDGVLDKAASASNASVAMVSLLFIVIAIAFGFAVYRRNAPMLVSTIVGVVAIILCMAIGMNFHPFYLSTSQWMIVVGIYIAVASVTPVWILLQPRDYLSSFLLYAMLAVAFIGVIGAHPSLSVATEDGGQTFAAFGGFAVDNGNGVQYLFPVLFTTVACGAISGFHSLVSSGTTSKQLDKETDAKPIAYGGMLLECVLAVLTLCAIAYARQTGHTGGATDIFAGGIAEMVAAIPGLAGTKNVLYTLLVLTYSAFCLTSLDTATRLARFMFQEFWLEPGQTAADVKDGYKKVLVNPYFATILTVVLGIALGMTGYAKIWGLFGAANQLLAALGLLAVATWLGNVGKNNKMFVIPMAFMLVVTICSLILTVKNQVTKIAAGGADWGPYAQAIIGVLLIVLAVILAIEGVQTLSSKKGNKSKAA
jgi:carbon starvation protein